LLCLCFVFFNDTATTEIYTLSLHDALPICLRRKWVIRIDIGSPDCTFKICRSEEHTSELQSLTNLVCRLLLEKKKHMLTSDSKIKTLHSSPFALSSALFC